MLTMRLIPLLIVLILTLSNHLLEAANYPLKVSGANAHVLVDQSDVPFLIHGDCAWGLMVLPNQVEVEEYLRTGGKRASTLS